MFPQGVRSLTEPIEVRTIPVGNWSKQGTYWEDLCQTG